MDSDTVFLRKPIEFVEWLEDKNNVPFHTRPKKPNLLVSSEVVKKAFPDIIIIEAFNSGFFGFRQSQLPVSTVLDVTKRLLDNPQVDIFGDESVWRLIFGRIDCNCFEFEKYPLFAYKDVYLGVKNNPDLRYLHFLGKHKYGIYAKVAKKVISELY